VATAVTIGTIGTEICGNNFWAVLLLAYAAIFVDTITKWISISKKYYVDTAGCDLIDVSWIQVIHGILGEAWGPKYLASRCFSRIIEKIFTYTVLITLCYAAGKWLPTLDLFGLKFSPSAVFPASASISVFLIEMSSINENLREMGQTAISDMLTKIVDFVINKITSKI
jgi:hypothetical protein